MIGLPQTESTLKLDDLQFGPFFLRRRDTSPDREVEGYSDDSFVRTVS